MAVDNMLPIVEREEREDSERSCAGCNEDLQSQEDGASEKKEKKM